MAKKNRDLESLDREEEVRGQLIRIGGCAAAVLAVVVVLLVISHSKKQAELRESEAASSRAAAASAAEAAAQADEEAFQQSIRDAGFEYVDLPDDSSYSEKVTILGTGDNLIHEALYKDAETDSGYDFSPMYELVKKDISDADIATINMETPLAQSVAPISGYPKFNSPDEAGEALIDAGFDVINQGNNHILDMGTDGLIATLDFWQERNIPCVGAYRNMDDLTTRRIVEVNGVKVAFLGFLSSLNGDLPEDSSIRLVTFWDESMIEDLIKDAKAHADVVVVHAHWGEEYTDELTETMTEMSQKMVDWGADIIFGNHTHILQRLEVLRRSSDGKLCPVLYSGGNFLSGQKSRECLLSGLLTVTVSKNPSTGDTELSGISFEPTVTHYEGDRKNVKIYPLSEYTEQLAESHGVKREDEPLTLEYLDGLVKEHISPQFLTDYLAETETEADEGGRVSLLGPSGESSGSSSEASSGTSSGGSSGTSSEAASASAPVTSAADSGASSERAS